MARGLPLGPSGVAALRDLAYGRAVSFFDYDWTLEKADAGNAMSVTVV